MAVRAYFPDDFFAFLRDLAKHNDRTWFTANKRRYERSVQDPAVRFVAEVGPRLRARHPHVSFDARPFGGSISRIYRDTRFSKDKSPYKTQVGIHFGHNGAGESEEHRPGFFLHLGAGQSFVASGIWRPEPPAARKIRAAIVQRAAGWAKVRAAGIELEGESYARVPTGLPGDHRFAEDLRRKDFITSTALSDAAVTSSRFGATFLDACAKIDPLNRFLATAVGIDW